MDQHGRCRSCKCRSGVMHCTAGTVVVACMCYALLPTGTHDDVFSCKRSCGTARAKRAVAQLAYHACSRIQFEAHVRRTQTLCTLCMHECQLSGAHIIWHTGRFGLWALTSTTLWRADGRHPNVQTSHQTLGAPTPCESTCQFLPAHFWRYAFGDDLLVTISGWHGSPAMVSAPPSGSVIPHLAVALL